MLTNLTLAETASRLVSAQAIKQPPTAPPSDLTHSIGRGA